MWTNSSASAGRRGDTQLTEVPNPAEEQAYYRVEEEFTQRHSRHGADHHGALRNGRTLHGVDRSGHPQCPNRAGDLPAVVRPTRWTLAAHTLVLRRGQRLPASARRGPPGVTAAAGSRADRATDCRRDCPCNLPTSPVPRPSPQGTPAVLPYPILRRLSSPGQVRRHAPPGGLPLRRAAAARWGRSKPPAGDAGGLLRGGAKRPFESQKAVETLSALRLLLCRK